MITRIGIIFTALVCLSCSNNDINPGNDLALKNVTYVSRGSQALNYTTDFFEDGRPMAGYNQTFVYDSEDKLTRTTNWVGFAGEIPTEYFYSGMTLIGVRSSSVGPDDGVIYHDEQIEYRDNVVEKHGYNESGELSYSNIFTFLTSNYEKLARYEYYSYLQCSDCPLVIRTC